MASTGSSTGRSESTGHAQISPIAPRTSATTTVTMRGGLGWRRIARSMPSAKPCQMAVARPVGQGPAPGLDQDGPVGLRVSCMVVGALCTAGMDPSRPAW